MTDRMDDKRREEIRAATDRAWAEVIRFAFDRAMGRDVSWRWSIPADPSRDSDLILTAPLVGVSELLADNDALTAELADRDAEAQDLRAEVERLRGHDDDKRREALFHDDWYDRGVRSFDPDEDETMPKIGNPAYYEYLTEVLTAADPSVPIRWGRVQLAIVLDRMIRADEARRAELADSND